MTSSKDNSDIKTELTNTLQNITDIIYWGRINEKVELNLLKVSSLLKEAIEDLNLSQEEIEEMDENYSGQ